jgi:hypothetical protein
MTLEAKKELKAETIKVTFESLSSGDKCINSIFFIKQLFLWEGLDKQERLRVLDYLRQEAESIIET